MAAEHRPPGAGLDALVVLLLVFPIFGTFYPIESYFGTWTPSGLELLPYWITPPLLVLLCLLAGWFFLRLHAAGRTTHAPLAYLFILLVFASVVQSSDPQTAFQRALRLLPLVALAVVLAQLLPFARLIRLMIVAFAVSALLSILMGAVFPAYGRSAYLGPDYAAAWRGATGHKNSAGYLYGLGVVLAAFAWAKGLVGRRLGGVTLVACLIMVAMAQSATAWFGMLLTLALGGLLLAWRALPRGVAPLLLVMGLGLAGAGALVVSTLPELPALTGRDASFTGRTRIWRAVDAEIARRPLTGHGYAFWTNASPERARIWSAAGHQPPHAHDAWRDLLLQLGLPGLLCIVLLALSAVVRAASALRTGDRTIASGALLVLCYVLARSFTEAQFTEPGTGGVFWLVWASTLARRAGATASAGSPHSAPPTPSPR